MAGFDKVDPANPCFLCSAGHIRSVARPHMTAKWAANLVEKSKRRSWTRQFQWSEITPRKSEPERQKSCAC
jgi:hypothetical protein